MKKNGIVNISINELYPHPDNPRKDVGDVSELAESLKKNGVMQNLTVIPGHVFTDDEYKQLCDIYEASPTEGVRELLNRRWSDNKYTIIIGHRRYAAAKLAGINELPCRIVELDKKEQVSTMLEENMQRNDLTVYEQAQGFQMMLNLGETEDTIAEKTGFSKTTIKHRLNIAKLDQEQLKKKTHDDGFQLTLKDLYALEGINDINTRNRILKESDSSNNLIWRVQAAIKEEAYNKTYREILPLLEKAGVKEAPEGTSIWDSGWEQVKTFDLWEDAPRQVRLPKVDSDMYYVKVLGKVYILAKRKKQEKTVSPEEKKRKELEATAEQLIQKDRSLRSSVKEFINSIIDGSIGQVKDQEAMRKRIWDWISNNPGHTSISDTWSFFSNKCTWNYTAEEKEEAKKKYKACGFTEQMLMAMFRALYDMGYVCSYRAELNKNIGDSILEMMQDILAPYGYAIEPEDRQLLDGSHELYHRNDDNVTESKGKEQ